MKIIFMGTPEFACGILQSLIDEDYDVVAVVSQPDKKIGRKQILKNTPVKSLALKYGIPVIQPIRIRNEYEEILSYKPDLIITCAYGQILPKELLDTPKYGCINVHASLLPKYRGGAPIHWSIINGEEKTGVTIMKMVEKMDAGCMYLQESIDINEADTTEILHDKLKELGSNLIIKFIPLFKEGKLECVEQDESKVTFGFNISKEDEFVGFKERNVRDIYNHIRGLIGWPVGYGIIENKRVKFHEVKMEYKDHNYKNGQIIDFNDGMKIACNGGYIYVMMLQMEGKSKITFREFNNGYGKMLINKCFK